MMAPCETASHSPCTNAVVDNLTKKCKNKNRMNKDDNLSRKITKKKSNPFWKFFWLSFLVLSLAYAWFSFYAPSNEIEWENNISSIEEITNSSNKNTLLLHKAAVLHVNLEKKSFLSISKNHKSDIFTIFL